MPRWPTWRRPGVERAGCASACAPTSCRCCVVCSDFSGAAWPSSWSASTCAWRSAKLGSMVRLQVTGHGWAVHLIFVQTVVVFFLLILITFKKFSYCTPIIIFTCLSSLCLHSKTVVTLLDINTYNECLLHVSLFFFFFFFFLFFITDGLIWQICSYFCLCLFSKDRLLLPTSNSPYSSGLPLPYCTFRWKHFFRSKYSNKVPGSLPTPVSDVSLTSKVHVHGFSWFNCLGVLIQQMSQWDTIWSTKNKHAAN